MRWSALFGAFLLACTSAPAVETDDGRLEGAKRDFRLHPAMLDLRADDVYAFSDPHGGLASMSQLLMVNGLIDSAPIDLEHARDVHWVAGKAYLVVLGDLIDKGPESLGVIDLLRTIEPQALAAGGRVIVLMGNHEAEFIADAKNDKAQSKDKNAIGINVELDALDIDPEDIAEGRDAEGRGEWMRNLPLGVRIKKWFFSHAGNTDGKDLYSLQKKLEDALAKNGFDDKDITGKDSILEAQRWFGDENKDGIGKRYCDALDVNHIVFGHDPGAFGAQDKIEMNNDATLIKINVEMGLTLNKSNTGGLLLHIDTEGEDSAEVLDSEGKSKKLL